MNGDATNSAGAWLKQQRKALDLTQEALAERVACSVETVRKIEAGKQRPSHQLAELLATHLEVPVAQRAAFVRWARETPAPPPPAATPIPELKGYVLEEPIDSGKFGTVYRAIQPGIRREVAVKIIRAEYANQPDFIRRFEAEAQFVARLEHPHIVPLYDYWRDVSGAYLVMRWVRGGSLKAALAAGTWSLAATTHLLEQIGPALLLAHRQGVIHRDIKPANILLDEDRNAYLADFGIAKDLRLSGAGEQTVPGTLIGSPTYLTPEQIQSAPMGPPTDVYSLGLVLYEMLSGQPAFRGSTPLELLDLQLHAPLPPLVTPNGDGPERVHAVLARATAKRPEDRYPDVDSLMGAFRQAVAGDMASPTALLTASPAAPDPEPENPYKGLRAFGEADARDFFGREVLTSRLLARLREPSPTSRFLAVVGPSGSGKSSVVLAGLLPAVRRGALPGADRWFVQHLIPGSHPFEELEAALLRVAVNPPASLLAQLQEDPRGLVRAVKRVLPDDPATELLLVIDQFEEVFTLVEDEVIRAHLLRSLALAVADPRSRLRVILTLRADFYDRPLLYGDLGELMRGGTELVLPLTARELEQAIAGPAARVNVTLEPVLLAAMIQDVGDQPGALPLLQYALTEVFERRDGRQMLLSGYQVSGGVLGALARRAEELYAALAAEEQELARQVFLRLVTPGEGVEDTRRRVRQSELAGLGQAEALAAVLEGFGRYRLLTFDRDPITREPTVEVAHEALIRAWGRLRDWLDSSRADVRTQRQLAAVATEWEGAGCDPSFLATGVRLAQFAALADGSSLVLTAPERTYVAASQAAVAQHEAAERSRQMRELALTNQFAQAQRNAANRLRALVGVLGVFLLITSALTIIAVSNASEADQQRGVAVSNAATSVANQAVANAQRQQAEANLAHSEALRLAAEANALLQKQGNVEAVALLAVRSLRTQYSPQGDAALTGAANLDYPRQLFAGHTGPVNAIAFTPNGRQVLTGSADGSARVWDARTGAELRRLEEPGGSIAGVAVSPDGRTFATAGSKGTHLWDSQTGKKLQWFPQASEGVAFSPDGRYLLVGSDQAYLWDVQTGQQVRAFGARIGAVKAVAFSPDGTQVLTGSYDQSARLWERASGKRLQTFAGHSGPVYAVAFAPDGRTMATASDDNTVRLWNPAFSDEIRSFTVHSDRIWSLAFAPDGNTLLTGSDDGTARLWEVATGREVRRFVGQSSGVLAVAFAPDGQSILTGGRDDLARLWHVQAQAELPVFVGHQGRVYGVAFSPDGTQVLTGSYDRTARLWDAQTGTEIRLFLGHTNEINGVAFAANGQTVLTASGDGTARLWNAQTGKELRRFSTNSPDPNSPEYVYTVAFSPDSRYVLAGGSRATYLWNAQDGRVLGFLPALSGTQAWGAAYSPDGKYILTLNGGQTNGGQTADLWDAGTQRHLRTFVGHTDTVYQGIFSPDNRWVLTTGLDQAVILWDLQSGAEIRRFIGPAEGTSWSVAFAPDGKTLLTGYSDDTARLWDIQTGKELRRFTGHASAVEAVAYSPDGQYVLTGSDDGTARLWDVDYHQTIRYLCTKLHRDFTEGEREAYGISDRDPTCPGP